MMLRIGNRGRGLTPTPIIKTAGFKSRLVWGFTMIELMVAVVILTVGLVLILQSLSSGMRTLTRAQNRFLATSIATEKLEDLEEEEFTNDGLEQKSFAQEKVTRHNIDFNVSIEITPHELDLAEFTHDFLPGEEPGYFPRIADRIHDIEVRVGWQERGSPQQLVLSTYLNAKESEQ